MRYFPRKNDVVYMLLSEDDGEDRWWKGVVKRWYGEKSTMQVLFDDGTVQGNVPFDDNDVLFGARMPPGCRRHQVFKVAGRGFAECNALQQRAAAAPGAMTVET